MKANKFLCAVFCMAALVAGMSSCKNDSSNSDVTTASLTLDKSVAGVAVGETTTITATVSPDGTATFASSNTAVATVTQDGNVATVTGVAAGTTYITATYSGITRTCAVQVSESAAETHASLQGSDYYILALDAQSAEKIQDKIVADYRPDDESSCLFIWSETFISNTPSGMNCYGNTESWYSLTVTSVGWSGLGLCVGTNLDGVVTNPERLDAMAEVYNNYADYTLHIAIKGNQGVPYLFGFDGNAGTGRVVLGSTSYVDGGNTYAAYADYTNDGEWNHYDVPVSYLVEQGWMFTTGNTESKNIMFVLAGGTAGTNVDYDAIFFYKKAQ